MAKEDMDSIKEKDKGLLKDGLDLFLEPNYPLLQRLREACPGTFKHSQYLASMIEGVSLLLDLDVEFMKIAAMYHDAGKLFNPSYFAENQIKEESPHDKLDPWISYQLISRHVSDGVNLLINEPNFPRSIIEIISQHHGNSIVRYFFDKSHTDIEDNYRYKCSKPRCVESAILMVCDCVEATSRSFVQNGKFDTSKTLIDTVINNLLGDGQLDEVIMRLGDLKKIKEALTKELDGIYQRRVDYDKAKGLDKVEE